MSSIFTQAWHWITGATKKIKEALGFGYDVANWLKELSDTGVLDVIVKATPWKWDDALLPGFKVFLANLLKELKVTEEEHTVSTAIYIASQRLKELSPAAKAIILNGINAAAAKWHAENVGKTKLEMSQALAAAQPVYDKVEVLTA
jgi:hypothetical protein